MPTPEAFTYERHDQTVSFFVEHRDVLPDGSSIVVLIGLIATTRFDPMVEPPPTLQRV